MLKEEFSQIKETKKDLRKFGLTVGIVLMAIGVLLFYFERPSGFYFIFIGVFLALLGILYPEWLKPLNKMWMSLAIILGFIMTRVILTIFYYLIITAIGFLAKIFRRKFMILKYDKSATTYWEKRTVVQKKQIDYERQF
jgi:hypothetical protein